MPEDQADIYAEVRRIIASLDGTMVSWLAMFTGFSREEIEDLGGSLS
jgi:hypothetical protein